MTGLRDTGNPPLTEHGGMVAGTISSMHECPNCGRVRVDEDGICGKCFWDSPGGDYASITRPHEYDSQGRRIIHMQLNDPFGGEPVCECGEPWPCRWLRD